MNAATSLRPIGKLDRRDPQWRPEPQEDHPGEVQIIAILSDAAPCMATDGCEIEPDGVCTHGHPSWLLRLGLI